MQLSDADALQYYKQWQNGNRICHGTITLLLQGVKGTTFARLVQCTNVPLAAAHKGQSVVKVTLANVQLFNGLNEFTSAYGNAVKRSAGKILGNDARDVEGFVPSPNYFEHTSCYSLVEHKVHRGQYYLYAIYNDAASVYLHNGSVASIQQVADMLTPANRLKLLHPDNTVENATHRITHAVTVRTTKLESIVSLSVQRQTAHV
jgi:hypothetical protein